MIKKILALLLIVSVCMSFSACKVKRSGKPYLNYYDGGADGFVYHTEEKQTDNFIAFTDRSGNLRLYLVSGEKYGVYYTEGLCTVDPGEIYKITYDVQIQSGGFGGDYNGYLLAVYSCAPVSTDDLFKNGYAESNFGNIYEFQYEGYYEAPDFVAFISNDGGYDVFSPGHGKIHYDEYREVKFDLEVYDQFYKPIEMEFNVLCNNDLTDESIIECLLTAKDPEGRFLYLNDYHPGEYMERTDYFSIERAAVEFNFRENLLYVQADEKSDERTRRVICWEDMTEKTAEELGLEPEVYEKIYKRWAYLKHGNQTQVIFERTKTEFHYDVLLFGGDLNDFATVEFGNDFRLYLSEDSYLYYDATRPRYQYVALFIRHEFNELIPQD